MTDPIADMLTRIRNAQKAKKRSVEVAFSNMKMRIAEILAKEGYIGKVEKQDGMPAMLVIELRYDGKRPLIEAVNRESTPGHRMYRKADELPRVLNDYGIAIISTSRGLMTNKEARKLGVGGEVICSIY
jgi:small subunit ribosomal protein S8